jgi:hypothetical protein
MFIEDHHLKLKVSNVEESQMTWGGKNECIVTHGL